MRVSLSKDNEMTVIAESLEEHHALEHWRVKAKFLWHRDVPLRAKFEDGRSVLCLAYDCILRETDQ